MERYTKTYRNEFLERYQILGLEKARGLTRNWIGDYNKNMLHDGLGDMSPRRGAQNRDISNGKLN
ncbi:integrase core domain-containing protein [Echinicola marina]|uniref:integrase core domain-containing protein n=1 Tax=Echinicola marina TaxID=2859768 RepID=UPI001CF6ECF8|nr:integrase core domain-containing protein [Echinicola marina]